MVSDPATARDARRTVLALRRHVAVVRIVAVAFVLSGAAARRDSGRRPDTAHPWPGRQRHRAAHGARADRASRDRPPRSDCSPRGRRHPQSRSARHDNPVLVLHDATGQLRSPPRDSSRAGVRRACGSRRSRGRMTRRGAPAIPAPDGRCPSTPSSGLCERLALSLNGSLCPIRRASSASGSLAESRAGVGRIIAGKIRSLTRVFGHTHTATGPLNDSVKSEPTRRPRWSAFNGTERD